MRPSPIRSFRRPSRSSGARSRKCGRAAPRWNRKARAGNDRRTRIGTRMSDKGMFGNLGNLMKQAQAMQERLAKLQAEIATKTVQASAGGGPGDVGRNGAVGVVSGKIGPGSPKGHDGREAEKLGGGRAHKASTRAGGALGDFGRARGGDAPGVVVVEAATSLSAFGGPGG